MYAGRVIERSGVHELYRRPAHPYPRALLESIPGRHQRGEPLTTIRGLPPNLLHIPSGCPFHPRCPIAVDRCREVIPPLLEPLPGRFAACHRTQEVLDGHA
jgi:oligopeptide transport system ATP-binding protein